MRKPRNYDSAEKYTEGKKLPAGGYICKIINVKEQTSKAGNEMLVLAFDIEEGEYANYYKEAYNRNTSEDKKWRGNYYIMVPAEDVEKDNWQLRMFKTNILKFEESNPGYHFDWEHPEKLTGLKIGMLFNEQEYVANNGANRFTTKPKALELIETIRSGDFEIPETEYLDNNGSKSDPTNNTFMDIPDNADGEQIPFNF